MGNKSIIPIQVQVELSEEQIDQIIAKILPEIIQQNTQVLEELVHKVIEKLGGQSCKKYLTTAEMEEKLGVKRTTIYNWVKQGLLPNSHKIGGSTRWDQDEVDEYIKNNSLKGKN